MTPTVLYFLGLPVGRDMDGYARLDLFKSAFTTGRPIAFVPTHNRWTVAVASVVVQSSVESRPSRVPVDSRPRLEPMELRLTVDWTRLDCDCDCDDD